MNKQNMKIICNKTDLLNSLQAVGRAVPARATHAVLANILISANTDDTVELKAFDLNLGIKATCTAQVKETGSITLPAKLLSGIIAKMPDGEISIECEKEDEDNPLATIKAKSSKTQLRGLPIDEFPELPIIQNTTPISLPSKEFVLGIQSTFFASSKDETKQQLTGIHLKLKENALEFAATDGHRLAVIELDTEKDLDEDGLEIETKQELVELTIPAKTLGEIEKILVSNKDVESVFLYIDEDKIEIEIGDYQVTSRTLNGTYPQYASLIPSEFQRTMVVERKALITSLERVSVLADSMNALVKFTLDTQEEQVEISTSAKELGSATERLNAQITGEDFEIGFNIKYLLEALKTLTSLQITFNFNEATHPVIIRPLNEEKITSLIMPVQVRQ